jgi:hypothetical protein
MEPPHADYDPRYLAGIVHFNECDYFEAHEVWEDAWTEATGDERRFYQGLIQAAVGLLHFANGNLRGAAKLYHSSRDYMRGLEPRFLGLDVVDFWSAMESTFEPLFRATQATGVTLAEDNLPRIELDPPPTAWPEMAPKGDDGAV